MEKITAGAFCWFIWVYFIEVANHWVRNCACIRKNEWHTLYICIYTCILYICNICTILHAYIWSECVTYIESGRDHLSIFFFHIEPWGFFSIDRRCVYKWKRLSKRYLLRACAAMWLCANTMLCGALRGTHDVILRIIYPVLRRVVVVLLQCLFL